MATPSVKFNASKIQKVAKWSALTPFPDRHIVFSNHYILCITSKTLKKPSLQHFVQTCSGRKYYESRWNCSPKCAILLLENKMIWFWLTFDYQFQGIRYGTAFCIGGLARKDAGRLSSDSLKDQTMIGDDHSGCNIIWEALTLEEINKTQLFIM